MNERLEDLSNEDYIGESAFGRFNEKAFDDPEDGHIIRRSLER